MEIQSLGHVVIRVKDLQKAETFYKDVLGLHVCAHYREDGVNMAFFSLGNHHDFAISESKELGSESSSGLDHVAFKIGNSFDDLLEAKETMEKHGLEMLAEDHNVTQSIYISDPDGNGIELYVDVSNAWQEHPELVASAQPLEL